jgi:hypothetical protein
MRSTPRIAVGILVVLASAVAYAAGPQRSAELQKAISAAERARSTPKGEEYQRAFSRLVGDALFGGTTWDCMPNMAPGVRRPANFQCVVIIGKTGKPKWIIRDSREPMAQCVCAKLVKLAYPPPPADNWPVIFGINMERQ